MHTQRLQTYSYFMSSNKLLRPTQPPTFGGIGNEYCQEAAAVLCWEDNRGPGAD